MSGRDFQFAAMNPEGAYDGLGDAVAIGSGASWTDEVLEILRKIAVNLLGVTLKDRPGYPAGLLP